MKSKLLAALVVVACALFAGARAATFTVTSLADSGPGSLRQAVIDANASSGEDTVVFSVNGSIPLGSELPTITDDTIIAGPGTNVLTINGVNAFRLLSFAEGSTNTVMDLTLANGRAATNEHGGAVKNSGVLRMGNCVVRNCETYGGFGGALYSSGDLEILGSMFLSNSAVGASGMPSVEPGGGGGGGGGGAGLGGALFLTNSTVLISNTTFWGNVAIGGRGGSCTSSNGFAIGGDGGGPAGGIGGADSLPGGPGGFGSGGGGGGSGTNGFSSGAGAGGAGGFGGGGGGGGASDGHGGIAGFGGGAGQQGHWGLAPWPVSGGGGGGAGLGGALFVTGGSVRMVDSQLISNSVTGAKGVEVCSKYIAAGDGAAGHGGGAFVHSGYIVIDSSGLLSNRAMGGGGGDGIYTGGEGGDAAGAGLFVFSGTVVLTNSTIGANQSQGGDAGFGIQSSGGPRFGGLASGGGIGAIGGNVIIANTTITLNEAESGNSTEFKDDPLRGADGYGGGIYGDGGSVALVNVTVTSNQVTGGLGTYLAYSTNRAPSGAGSGGGVYSGSSAVTALNSLFAFNIGTTNSGDLVGSIASFGFNLVNDTNSVTSLIPSDLAGVDPMITPLGKHGGSTLSHMLLAGSPAIDAGTMVGAPFSDQRGALRPMGAGVDIGATERHPLQIIVDAEYEFASPVMSIGQSVIALDSTFPNATILYTLDGLPPTFSSSLYSGPFLVDSNVVIRALAYNADFTQTQDSETIAVVIVPVYTLSVITNGWGSVSVSPLTGPYPSNSLVTLTASAGSNYNFAGWSGDASGTTSQLLLTMDSDKTVEANFIPFPTYTLSITTNGHGSITASPAQTEYPSNSTVTLTATAGENSFFEHWSGDAIGTNTTANVVMSADRSVTAHFVPGYALTLLSAGGGSAVASPAAALYRAGTEVQISALPSNGWQLLYWRGDSSNTESNINLVMDASKALQPVFGTPLVLTEAGSGYVVPEPALTRYPYGCEVQLTAMPFLGSQFALWGNEAAGSANPLKFLIQNSEPMVSALFVPLESNQVALTVTPVGRGSVEVTPFGNAFPLGQNVTITASPSAENEFLGWGGDASGSSNPLVLSLTSSMSVVARFTALPTLRVTPPLDGMTPTGFRFSLDGIPGESYTIYGTSDFSDWANVLTVTNLIFGDAQLLDRDVGSELRFYRATEGAIWAPTGLTASDGAYNDRVEVTWNSVSSAVAYEVWRATSDDSSAAIKISNPDPIATLHDDTEVEAAATYYYWVKAKDGTNTSAFSLSDSGYRQPLPPAITIQPQSRTNVVGSSLIFSVRATSETPPTYQWFKGTSPLNGETNRLLVLVQVQQADAGAYSAWVSNAAGGLSSSTAFLTVREAALPAVIAGPIVNPGNGNEYYLLDSSTWVEAEAAAQLMGGHLATLRNEAEHSFVYTNFGYWDGQVRHLCIGLMDPDPSNNSTSITERREEFVWASGEPVVYSNWLSDEPNNWLERGEFWVHIIGPDPGVPNRAGYWNDVWDTDANRFTMDAPLHGVVEIDPLP